MGVGDDVIDGILSTLDFFRLSVRDINGELVLDVENELDLFERVQTEILLEVRVRCDGVGVHLVEALDHFNHTGRDFLVREAMVLTIGTQKALV